MASQLNVRDFVCLFSSVQLSLYGNKANGVTDVGGLSIAIKKVTMANTRSSLSFSLWWLIGTEGCQG